MQKALKEVAVFYKLRGTLPRPDAKAHLNPWAGQHIGTAETSSIHLIPSTKAPYESTTSLHLLSYTCLPIWFCSTCGTQFLLFGLVEELYTNAELFWFYIAVIQMLSYFDFSLSFLTYSDKKSLLKEIPLSLPFETHL